MKYQIGFVVRTADYDQEYVIQQGNDNAASIAELQKRTLAAILYISEEMIYSIEMGATADAYSVLMVIEEELYTRLTSPLHLLIEQKDRIT